MGRDEAGVLAHLAGLETGFESWPEQVDDTNWAVFVREAGQEHRFLEPASYRAWREEAGSHGSYNASSKLAAADPGKGRLRCARDTGPGALCAFDRLRKAGLGHARTHDRSASQRA